MSTATVVWTPDEVIQTADALLLDVATDYTAGDEVAALRVAIGLVMSDRVVAGPGHEVVGGLDVKSALVGLLVHRLYTRSQVW